MAILGATTVSAAGDHPWIVCPTPPDEPAAQACWFCGAALVGAGAVRRAREHVFARWLLRELGAQKHAFSVSWNDAHERNVLDQRNMVLDAFVTGRVCERCNTGWMSRLEDAVRDDLAGLAHGTRDLGALDEPALEVLAKWAVKTAYAAQSVALGPKLVPAGHRGAMCAGDLGAARVVGRLSPVNLGLTTYGAQRWQIAYPRAARAEVVDAVAQSYKVVLTVGRLVLAVCFWPEPTWPMAISRRSHIAIWPPPGLYERRPRGVWRTYEHATDRHGVPPDAVTEVIDMVVGTIVAHPTSADRYAPLVPG